jgi:ketosteroid isomerase-like protein
MLLRTPHVGRALVFSAILWGCAQPSPGERASGNAPVPTHIPAELEEALAAFYAGVEAGEGDRVVTLFDADMVMMPDGGELVVGGEVIAPGWADGVAAGFRLRDVAALRTVRSGDLAYRINLYSWSMPDEAGERTWYRTKNVHIWKRQPDGSWKLQVDIWNESPEEAAEETTGG